MCVHELIKKIINIQFQLNIYKCQNMYCILHINIEIEKYKYLLINVLLNLLKYI